MSISRRKHPYVHPSIAMVESGGKVVVYLFPSCQRHPANHPEYFIGLVEINTCMAHKVNKGIACLLVLLVSSAGVESRADDQLKGLLERGDYQSAYEHALTLSPQLEGQAGFDFLLGMAALKSGHLPEAVFAFERVLMAEPENHRARLELARVYFLQNDYQNAKTEFLAVRTQRPPADVKENIDRYLEAINKELKAMTGSFSVHISTAAGHDSNINSSTDIENVYVPALGTVTLNQSSKEISDQFSEINVGMTGQYLLNRHSSLSAKATVNSRNNFNHSEFNIDTANVRVAYQHKTSSYNWLFPLNIQQINVGGDTLRRMFSIGADFSKSTNKRLFSVGAQLGGFAYPDYQHRDANFATSSLNWKSRFVSDHSLIFGGINFGYEDPKRDSGAGYGRRYGGVQLGWQWLGSDYSIYSSAFFQSVEHTDLDSVFLKIREDSFYQLALGYAQSISPRWVVELGIQGVSNNSNIALYDYDRVLFKGGVNYVY